MHETKRPLQHPPVILDHIAAVLPNCVRVWRVAKNQSPFPSAGKVPQPAEREGLSEVFLRPLAQRPSFATRIPAIAEYMPRLMTELVVDMAPGNPICVHENPGNVTGIVEQNERGARRASFEPKPPRLLIYEQPDSRETCLTQTRNDNGRGTGQRCFLRSP